MAPVPPQQVPPAEDADLETLARYYFSTERSSHPDDAVMERLAYYYFVTHPHREVPPRLLAALYRHYGTEDRAQLRIAVLRRHRLRQRGIPPTDSAGIGTPDAVMGPGPDPVAVEDFPVTAGPPPEVVSATPPPPAPAAQPDLPVLPTAAPAEAQPVAVSQLSGEVLRRDEPLLLMAAASFTQSAEALKAVLGERFSQIDPDAQAGAAVSTELASDRWGEFAEIGAEIVNCPHFMSCDSLGTRVAFNRNQMLWSWKLSLNPDVSNTSKSEFVSIRFRGYASAADTEGTEIQSIPVVKLKFAVTCAPGCIARFAEELGANLKTTTGLLDQIKTFLGSLTAVLATLGGLLALVGGWIAKRRHKSKTQTGLAAQ